MQTEQTRDPLIEFAKRWWWLLLIGIMIGAGAAIAYTRYGPVSYVSHAYVQAPAPTTTNNRTAQTTTQNLATEGSSARMIGLVSQAIAGKIDLTEDDLQTMERNGDIVVRTQRNTTFIEISVTHTDPNVAEDLANVWSTTFADDVNSRYGAQFSARRDLLQRQVDFVRTQLAAAGLFERESDLKAQLRDQRALLLSLEANYQRAVDERTNVQANADDSSTTTTDTQSQPTALETIVLDQISEVQGNIETIEQELERVQTTITGLPEGTDPLISSAYAAAYASELTTLTNQIVEEQILEMSTPPALIRYGDASSAVRADGMMKFLFLGIAAGGAVFAAFGLLFDWIKQRRRAKQDRPATVGAPEFEKLLQEIGRLGGVGDTRDRASDGKISQVPSGSS